jgi:hypothetical protein
MKLVRPRFTDIHGVSKTQAELPFAIPFLHEDIPLYVDPFLLWKSPSQQDKGLHLSMLNAFNNLGHLAKIGKKEEALKQLILASECDEVGLGVSATRQGKRIGNEQAQTVLDLFTRIPEYGQRGFRHFEEIQFYVDGISKDRISDFACNFIKSFLIDFTMDECDRLSIPLEDCTLQTFYDPNTYTMCENVASRLPVHPETKAPLLLVPKRWLRFGPWLNFDDYFKAYCPRDELVNPGEPIKRVEVLMYNREHYGAVDAYIREKERTSADCVNDPLFRQVPVVSAQRSFAAVKKLPTGKDDNADRKYEDTAAQLLASLLYPHLDFAEEQSRTDSGVVIRDLIFYNNRSHPFLKDLNEKYGSQQLVMELKNVRKIEREHINQLNRYMTEAFGRFGILVTRNELPTAMMKNTIDLWAGQRRCIIALTDVDLGQMVDIYESKQRSPLDVLSKKYVEFLRECPS